MSRRNVLNYSSLTGPVIDFDFVNNPVDGRLITSRASGASYFDNTGTLQTAAANTPRIDYGPLQVTTNQIRNSICAGAVVGTPGTYPLNWLVTSNNGLSYSVVGLNNESGLNCIDFRIFGTTNASAASFTCIFDQSINATATTGQTWTSSVNCRLLAGTILPIAQVITFEYSSSVQQTTNLAASLVTSGPLITSNRSSVTKTFVNANTVAATSGIYFQAPTSGTVVDFTVRIAAPQLEQNSVATKFVPTGWYNAIRNSTMQGAIAGTPGTFPTNWTAGLIGLSQQIIGSGLINNQPYIDIRCFGTTTAQYGGIYLEVGNSVSFVTGQNWIFSGSFALIAGSLTNIALIGLIAEGNNSSGSYLNNCNAYPGSTPLNSVLTFSQVVITNSNSSVVYLKPKIYFNTTAASGQTIDFTIRIAAPQLELTNQASTNNIVYSQNFTGSGWSNANILTINTNAAIAPDGTNTASKIVENTTASMDHQLFYSYTASNLFLTFSLFLKAAERNRIYLQISNTSNEGKGAYFDLVAGNIISIDTNGSDFTNISGTINFIGNGWYRCSVSMNKAAVNTVANPFIHPVNTGTNVTYTGDGTSGLYVWGAQIEKSNTVGGYVPTNGAIATQQVPATTWYPTPNIPSANSKIIQPQNARINYIRNSTIQGAVVGTPGTLPTNWGNYASSGLSQQIVAAGVINGMNYIDIRFYGTSNNTYLVYSFDNTTSVSPGQIWTNSVYMALIGGSFVNISSIALETRWDSGGTGDGNFLTSLSSFLTKYWSTNIVPATAKTVAPCFYINFSNASAIDITIRFAQPQLELGYSPTLFIPTYGTVASVNAIPLGLLVEESRTNSIRNPRAEGAVAGTPGTNPTNW